MIKFKKVVNSTTHIQCLSLKRVHKDKQNPYPMPSKYYIQKNFHMLDCHISPKQIQICFICKKIYILTLLILFSTFILSIMKNTCYVN